MLRPISAVSSLAIFSIAPHSSPPPSSAAKAITLAPLSKSRTVAIPAAPTASSPSSAAKAVAFPQTRSSTKFSASPNPATAKSSSAASTSAPTAAIFPLASNSNLSSAASSAKPPSNVSASALSSPSTSPRISSASSPQPIASPSTFTCRRDDLPEGLEKGTTPALSTNYLKVRVNGTHPPNNFLDVLISAEIGTTLAGELILSSAANGACPDSLGMPLS